MLKRLLIAAVGVVGLVVIGLGVASATVWRADDVLVARGGGSSATLVTDPGVLELGGDPVTVTVTATGKSPVVLAVGRDTDVAGWVGTDEHARVTGLTTWHELAVQDVAATAPTPAPTDAATDAATPAPTEETAGATEPPATVADPKGSDLWVAEADGTGEATLTWHAQPGRWSLIAVSTGSGEPVLEMSWPRVVTTPWLWPCVVAGAVLVLLAGWLLLRDVLRRRAGHTEPDWTTVTTGPVPAVPTLTLTRRQLRERQAAGRPRTADEPTPSTPTPAVPAEAGTGPGLTAAPTTRRALRTGSIPVVDAPANPATGGRPNPGAPATGAPGAERPAATAGGWPTASWTPTPSGSTAPGASDRPERDPAGAAPSSAPWAGSSSGRPEARPGTVSPAPVGAAGVQPRAGAVPAPGDLPRPDLPGRTTGPESRRPVSAVGPYGPGAPDATAAPTGTAAGDVARRGPEPSAVPTGARLSPPGDAGAHGRPSWASPRPAPTPSDQPPASPQLPRPSAQPAATSSPLPRPSAPAGWSSGPQTGAIPTAGGGHRPAWLAEHAGSHRAAPETGPDAADDAGAGSRADAWRRAWGLPPVDDTDRPTTEGEEDR